MLSDDMKSRIFKASVALGILGVFVAIAAIVVAGVVAIVGAAGMFWAQ